MCRYCWVHGVILRTEEAETMAQPQRDGVVWNDGECGDDCLGALLES